jgi:parallel beta-helix repeat protein
MALPDIKRRDYFEHSFYEGRLSISKNHYNVRNHVNVFFKFFVALFILLLSLQSYADNGPLEVWVSRAYSAATPGWGVTYFDTIQNGINAVAEGGTVHVFSGTYPENLIIDNKRLVLSGEGAATTVIDGRHLAKCLRVLGTSGTVISGFTFTNALATGYPLDFAVSLENGEDITFKNNRLTGDGEGIGFSSNNCLILNNRIEGNGSIFFIESWGSRIEGNELYVSSDGGIWMMGSSKNNVIAYNTIVGVEPEACTGIRLWLNSNNAIINNTFKNFRVHILLSAVDNCIIANNNISGYRSDYYDNETSAGGIVMNRSGNNIIINNTISDVNFGGLLVLNSSSNNVIQANSIVDIERGIGIYYHSNDNLIVNNDVSSNSIGIIIDDAYNNTLARNNFSNNGEQGFDDGINAWNNEGMGNYWSNYTGPDHNGDGIGDIPHQIAPQGLDLTPSAVRFNIVPASIPELKLASSGPLPGAIEINDVTIWDNKTMEIKDIIRVQDGGHLIIRNADLDVTFNFFVDFIEVLSGGSLEIFNSKIISHGPGIHAYPGSNLRVEYSQLDGLGLWDGGGALDVKCDGAIIKYNLIRQAYMAIGLWGDTSHHQIIGNKITEGFFGITTCSYNATGMRFENNLFSNFVSRAIHANGGIDNNTFIANIFQDIWWEPIRLPYGGAGNPAIGNVFSKNSFVNCRTPPHDPGNNRWYDNGLGNYWSDYTGRDANGDGIGDSYYFIPDNGVDRYPLIAPLARYKSPADVISFVTRFYQLCLDRNPDSTGLSNWGEELLSEKKTGADVAYGFIFSPEFEMKSIGNDDYLKILYRAFFDREPEPAGLQGWLDALQSGVSREEVLNGFIYAKEFEELCDQYDIKAFKGQASKAQREIEAFVIRFYQLCLNRNPDPPGLAGWTKNLLTKIQTGADVAYGFIFSQEFINKNVTNEEYLTILYKAFFNRDPDQAGWDGWLAELNGGTDRGVVLNGFLGSQEFIKLCEDYGITPL